MSSERNYAERLREQAYKTLSPQIQDLQQEMKDLGKSLADGIYQIERKLEAVRHVELPTTEAVLDEIMGDVLRQRNQQGQSLASFVRDIRGRETQEEILGMLLDCTHRFFPAVALFTVRQDRLTGWSSRGYSEETAHRFADFSIPHSECPRLREALECDSVTTLPDLADVPALGFLLAESAGQHHLVPLHVLHRPVALLYAADPGEADLNALSILADLTVLRLENIALKILYALTGTKTAPAQAEAAAARAPAGAETAAPADTAPSGALAGQAPAEGALAEGAEAPREEPAQGTEEERLHADAQRFARLLVSEIKLYNENHVVEGRRNRDLYLRLKRDVDKSREMYENRIAPLVARKNDYFHDEIVRILGEGDPSTLGNDYPGPKSPE